MSLSFVLVREAQPQRSAREERRAATDPVAAPPLLGAGSIEDAQRDTSPDLLELLLLHGDCAFLLDLRQL